MKTLQYTVEDNGYYDLITVYSEDGKIFTELEAGKFPDNERFFTDEDEIQLYLDDNGYGDEEFEIRPLSTLEEYIIINNEIIYLNQITLEQN